MQLLLCLHVCFFIGPFLARQLFLAPTKQLHASGSLPDISHLNTTSYRTSCTGGCVQVKTDLSECVNNAEGQLRLQRCIHASLGSSEVGQALHGCNSCVHALRGWQLLQKLHQCRHCIGRAVQQSCCAINAHAERLQQQQLALS